MNWLWGHIHTHPIRLLVTTMGVVLITWALAGCAIVLALDSTNDATVATCRSLNELRREIYVAAADLGVPKEIRARFLPTENCEALP